jgi:Family of unknown function (DUF6314)
VQLQAFAGHWKVDREIEDARAGRTGRFTGRAEFRAVDDGLAYREEGTLVMGQGPALAAARAYFWREAGAGAIEVRFEDGRLFHRFCADDPDPAAEHDCPPDRYRVRYDFARWPRWRAEWRVNGPRKDYVTVTRYRRAES